MNIVILGAGNIGLHLATLFSALDYGIVLVDIDPAKLEWATRDLDVVTKVGSGTNWELLEELLEQSPDLLIATTNDDETNLVACRIAKHLGYPQTIARVRKPSYFASTRLNFERLFSVDHLIGPEKLTADSMASTILGAGCIVKESFAHGSVEMITFQIPPKWRKEGISLAEKESLGLPDQMMVGLIHRFVKKKETILFPHGSDTLLAGDEVTFIGERQKTATLPAFLGLSPILPRSVVIVGGSLIATYLAKDLLERGIHVEIIEKEYAKCCQLSDMLPNCTILHHDGLDYRFLESERVGEADFFVGATHNDEVNLLAATSARELGCKHALVSLSDTNLIAIAKRLGIDYTASARITAANRILSIAREKRVASMVSLYDNKAEIMEVKVSIDSKIAGIPIRALGPELPTDFLIAVIQSRGRVFIADGNRVLTPGDTAIVISSPKHISEIRRLF